MSDRRSSESKDAFKLETNQSLLPSEFDSTQLESFAAMGRAIERAQGFTLILAICNTPTRREQLTQALAARFPETQTLYVTAETTDPLSEIERLQPNTKVLFIAGLEYGFSQDVAQDHPRLLSLNQRREDWPRLVPVPVVIWLPEFLLQPLARAAPDFLNWRIGTYSFVEEKESSHIDAERFDAFPDHSRIPAQERKDRIAHLQKLITSYAKPGQIQDQAVALWQRELLELWMSLGELDDAYEYVQGVFLPQVKAAGDRRNEAEGLFLLASLEYVKGNYTEALESYEVAKDLVELLDADRDVAVTQGRIADVLQARGELDEALRLYQGEILPSFQRLGDVRSEAVTQGRIADVLQARGELDEALRIRCELQLPVYQRLGDVHQEAVTQGKIADVLQARGELDEALRLYQEEVLPSFQRLGDVRSEAVTQGKIADVLQARGELDEALRIRREEELPVYQRLGDVRSEAVTQGQIADVLQARGELDEALRIRREEELPVYQRLGDVRSEAVTQGQIADVLQARGELDEALRIRRELQLPVYQRLGDVRSEAVTQNNIALNLLLRGKETDRAEAYALLQRALNTCEKLRIPEAEFVKGIIKKYGLDE